MVGAFDKKLVGQDAARGEEVEDYAEDGENGGELEDIFPVCHPEIDAKPDLQGDGHYGGQDGGAHLEDAVLEGGECQDVKQRDDYQKDQVRDVIRVLENGRAGGVCIEGGRLDAEEKCTDKDGGYREV